MMSTGSDTPAGATDALAIDDLLRSVKPVPAGWSRQAKRLAPLTDTLKVVYALLFLTYAAWGTSVAALAPLAYPDLVFLFPGALYEIILFLAGYVLSYGAWAITVLFIVAAGLHLWWVYRAHSNLEAARSREIEGSSTWAIGWHFIPFANLYMPGAIMARIWRGSHPIGSAKAPAPATIAIWWGCYVAGNILSRVSVIFEQNAFTEEGEILYPAINGYLALELVSVACILVAIIVLWSILNGITKAQDARTQEARALLGAAA